MAVQSGFLWGKNGEKLSPKRVAALRQVQDALWANRKTPTNIGEGIASFGDPIRNWALERRAGSAEEAGRAEADAAFEALMAGGDPMAAMGNEWLTADPGRAAVVQAMLGQKLEAQDPMRQLQLAQAQLNYDQDLAGNTGDMSGYGQTVYMGRDADGNPIPMRVGPQGLESMGTPEGVTWDPGGLAQDRAEGTKIGAAIGDAAVGAPGDIGAADVALNLLDSIENDPALPYATGPQAQLGMNNIFPDRVAFQKKVTQAQGGAFLTAIQQLRGMGALSNAEGQTATAAVTRMDTALEDEYFLEALNEYRAIIERGRLMAEEIINGTRSPLDAPPPLSGPGEDVDDEGFTTIAPNVRIKALP